MTSSSTPSAAQKREAEAAAAAEKLREEQQAAAAKEAEEAAKEEEKARKEQEKQAKKAEDASPTPSSSIVSQPADPIQPTTSVGSDGVERIVTTGSPAWTPAGTEPDPIQVKRAKEREEAAEKARKERLGEKA